MKRLSLLIFMTACWTLTACGGTDFVDVIDDPDGDGLSSELEEQLGTNPNEADSDGDGISDGDEFNEHGTDPLNADTDVDGESDSSEISVGSDPNDPTSTDGDEGGSTCIDPACTGEGASGGEEGSAGGGEGGSSSRSEDGSSSGGEEGSAGGSEDGSSSGGEEGASSGSEDGASSGGEG